jgi:transposase InsO family protein
LQGDGLAVNHKKVARVMRRHRIQGLRLPRRVQTTIADPAAAKAPDLIGRDFTAAAVNQRYVGDITIYRSANADSFTWQRLSTCTHAAWRAGRSPITCVPTWSSTPSRRPSGLGAASTELSSIPIMEQYTSNDFAAACEAAGVRQSMSAVGSSADNALAESFNASFKRETLQGRRAFTDEREARLASFGWLHRYNTIRRHSRLGQQSPINYENSIQTTPATLAPAA